MANYEMMVILDPTLSDADSKETIKIITKIVKDAKGKVTKEDIWGEKKLAYKINGSQTGFYCLFDLELDGTKIKTLNGTLNLEKNIWRYMFVNKDA